MSVAEQFKDGVSERSDPKDWRAALSAAAQGARGSFGPGRRFRFR